MKRRLVPHTVCTLFLCFGLFATGPTHPAHAAMPSGITHVFTIVFENHDWSTIKGSPAAPYLNSLLIRPDAVYASNYHNLDPRLGTLHPSEPGYVWLEAATNTFPDHTFTTDNPPSAANSTDSPDHLTALLEQKGLTWRSDQEDISGTSCPLSATGDYAPKHNPMVFFQDVTNNNKPASATCINHIRPFSELSTDLAQNDVANYNFITPNLIHDMHDGTIAQADTWLQENLPTILNSPVYQNGSSVVFLTWDEGGTGNDPIGMIILSPKTRGHGYTNSHLYDHSAYVKTIANIFGLPRIGHAADPTTRDLSDFFSTPPSLTPTIAAGMYACRRDAIGTTTVEATMVPGCTEHE